MFAKPTTPPTGAKQIERRRLILNEKCKAQSCFFYNLRVAVVTASPVANLIRQGPIFDPPLIILSCTFGAIFHLLGNNRLDQMVD